MVAIFRREGGLTAADTAEISRAHRRASTPSASELAADGRGPVPAHTRTSRRRSTVRRRGRSTPPASTPTPAKSETIIDPVDEARKHHQRPGRRPGGEDHRRRRLLRGRDQGLRVASTARCCSPRAALVFVLLILIYRSPFFFLIPLVAVALRRAGDARSSATSSPRLGVTVNGQSSSILLRARARRGHRLRAAARRRATARSCTATRTSTRRWRSRCAPPAPAIVASALTVQRRPALPVAWRRSTAPRASGRSARWASLVALVTMLTLLPALLVIFGRRAFWPLVPYGPAGAPEPGRLARLPLLRRLDAFGPGLGGPPPRRRDARRLAAPRRLGRAPPGAGPASSPGSLLLVHVRSAC